MQSINIPFRKMHGLGNDFVVIDNRLKTFNLSQNHLRHMANRHLGIGCDQVIVLEPPGGLGADVFMRIYNPDGSESGACGNATRCVASLIMEERQAGSCVIETISGLLGCRAVAGDMVEVDMGAPRLNWDEIPLSEDRDTLHPGIEYALSEAVIVNMGNPHCVFFVGDVNAIPLHEIGPGFERHPLFPQKTNVEFAQILEPGKIRMRVWERGAGVTMACGSGACAVMVAAARRGLCGRSAEIILDGGSLFLNWREDDHHVLMTGPATSVFTGSLAL